MARAGDRDRMWIDADDHDDDDDEYWEDMDSEAMNECWQWMKKDGWVDRCGLV